MNVEQKVNIHNRFDIEVRDASTGELRNTATAFNIVLDQMWTRLCAGNTYFTHIHFGTGSGEVSPLRTSLFSNLGNKAAIDDEVVKAIPVSRWKRKIVLNPEEYVGRELSEVGIAYGTGTTNMVTHALLKDAEGHPVTILKTDTDVVTIYATVFVTFRLQAGLEFLNLPAGNSLINYLIGGSSAPSGSFGVAEIKNAFARLGSTSSAAWTSDTAARQRRTNINRFGTTVANGHIRALNFSDLFELEIPVEGVFTSQPYTDIPIGVGTGTQKTWHLPSANIVENTLIVKRNNDITTGYSPDAYFDFFVRRANPASPPTGDGQGVALTPDGQVMAVAHNGSPFISTYDWMNSEWVKRANPVSRPAGRGYGVALTPDGQVMAVAHENSPYISTYDWVNSEWVKRANPASLPTGTGNGVALTSDGQVMAVAHYGSPYISTYDWVNDEWVKRPDPANIPSNYGYGVALTPDGQVMAVAHNGSPFISTYDWVNSEWVKRANPASLPTGTGRGITLTPDGQVMAVAHDYSPYISTYDWVNGEWVKRPNLANLPANDGQGVALTPDGQVMAVAHNGSPFISTYDWMNSEWVKRANPVSRPAGRGRGITLTPDGQVMAVAHDYSPYISTYTALPFTKITFDTPPALGDVITADYGVEGIHKTDQYVVDASFAIQFGEGE